jgi:hypothetical protein
MNTSLVINLAASLRPAINPLVNRLSLFSLAALILLGGTLRGHSQTTVLIDPVKSWAGYMNWQPIDPTSPYGNYGASSWSTTDLQANFAGTNLTLAPNISGYGDNPGDPGWINLDDNTGANLMEANFYVTDDTLVNMPVTFTGFCQSNSLAAGYTSQAFIKVFNSDYSVYLGSAFVDLVAGQTFTVTLDTTFDGAAHVQYGFNMVGPNANPDDIDSLGQVVLTSTSAVIPPPVLQVPTNNAPTPTRPADEVLSMYNSSGTYVDHAGIVWYAAWSGANGKDFTITNTGSIVKKETDLQYGGVEFYNPNQIDTTGFNMLHVDVWTPNANQFGIQLVSLNPTTPSQVDILPDSGTITSNNWVGLDIPLSQFAAINPGTLLNNLEQLLWIDNQAGGGVTGGTFYIDNVYFYSSSVVTPPAITVDVSNGSISLSFPTQNGSSYTVQYKDNLTDDAWQTLTTLTGDGSVQTATDSVDQPQRFYRVSVQ